MNLRLMMMIGGQKNLIFADRSAHSLRYLFEDEWSEIAAARAIVQWSSQSYCDRDHIRGNLKLFVQSLAQSVQIAREHVFATETSNVSTFNMLPGSTLPRRCVL